MFLDGEEKVVVDFDTTPDSDEDPAGCKKGEEKDECEVDAKDAEGGDVVEKGEERDECEGDDESSAGGAVVCKTMGLVIDCCT